LYYTRAVAHCRQRAVACKIRIGLVHATPNRCSHASIWPEISSYTAMNTVSSWPTGSGMDAPPEGWERINTLPILDGLILIRC